MRRQGLFWLALAIIVTLGLPTGAAAQEEEEEPPPVLRLSFFMCNFGSGAGERVNTELEERDIPIWRELVSEGMIQDHGYFYHWWADEWNLGVYTIGSSIQGIIDAVEEADDRWEERYGEGPTEVGQACPHHRDGFYTLGPNAGMEPPGGN